MKRIFSIVILFVFLTKCSSNDYIGKDNDLDSKSLNYIAFTSELIDSIGISFYDTKKLIYRGDSTYVIYSEGRELIFYHFESRKIVKRLQFSVEVENCSSFSVASTNDVVVHYGNTILRMKDGVEDIIEIPEAPYRLSWTDGYGFEYFPNQNKVVLGLNNMWPGDDSLNYYLKGLASLDLNTRTIEMLPFEYSQIYHNAEYWGTELYLYRKGDTLLISENWGSEVILIDMNNLAMNKFTVRHPQEHLMEELPLNLNDHEEFIPKESEQKSKKYALWELRHYFFEKYQKALIDQSGRFIYRFYEHRIPTIIDKRRPSRHEKAKFILRYDIDKHETVVFNIPSNRFYVPSSFWLRPNSTIDHIKFIYTKEHDPDKAIYLLENIKLYSI